MERGGDSIDPALFELFMSGDVNITNMLPCLPDNFFKILLTYAVLATLEINETTKRTKKSTKTTFATVAKPAAMPPKPSTAAMIAPTKNINVHFNIIITF